MSKTSISSKRSRDQVKNLLQNEDEKIIKKTKISSSSSSSQEDKSKKYLSKLVQKELIQLCDKELETCINPKSVSYIIIF